MRRLSIHRPKEKVRNPNRHLRALEKWADQFEGYYPTNQLDQPYLNWKIPVLDRLIEGSTTSPEIQSQCLWQMLRAAEHMIDARPAGTASRVTLLVPIPDMFHTEICIFQSAEYMNNFFKRDSKWEKWVPFKDHKDSLLNHLIPYRPMFMSQKGYKQFTRDEDDDNIVYESEIWVLGETLPIMNYK